MENSTLFLSSPISAKELLVANCILVLVYIGVAIRKRNVRNRRKSIRDTIPAAHTSSIPISPSKSIEAV